MALLEIATTLGGAASGFIMKMAAIKSQQNADLLKTMVTSMKASTESADAAATRVSVEIRIEIAAAALARIAANPTQRFMMYIETANHTLTRANSDKEQILIDANDFYIDNYRISLLYK